MPQAGTLIHAAQRESLNCFSSICQEIALKSALWFPQSAILTDSDTVFSKQACSAMPATYVGRAGTVKLTSSKRDRILPFMAGASDARDALSKPKRQASKLIKLHIRVRLMGTVKTQPGHIKYARALSTSHSFQQSESRHLHHMGNALRGLTPRSHRSPHRHHRQFNYRCTDPFQKL
eukprot:1155822-Pelagomonas_calceolata.AAC.3